MGWKPDHKPIREKYNPVPNAAEARHEDRVRELPCYGCGRHGTEGHHTFLNFPEKRWKRDHRYQLPLCPHCHRGPYGVHALGNEAAWLEMHDRTADGAIAFLLRLWAESEAMERKAA